MALRLSSFCRLLCHRNWGVTLAAWTALLLVLAVPRSRASEIPWDTFSDTWAATDALGRSLPMAAESGSPRAGKTVGIFYFLWLTGNGPVHDLTKIFADNPDHPNYGKPGAFHFWGEPLFGYYSSDDEFVIRKHAQMLNDAGVDVVFFDVTNGLIYEQTYLTICRVFSQMRKEGQRTPQIAFLANSHHERVVNELDLKFYSKQLHADLWFMWKGKPLLLSPPGELSAAATNFFTLRHSWAWTKGHKWFGDGRDKWPWLDHTPQYFGWHESPQRPEQIAVAVAEHPISNIGRSFHHGRQPPPAQTRTEAGMHFGEQWARALEVNPEFVFVTGWNEWIAQRFLKEAGKAPGELCGEKLKPGDTFFVDAFSEEFSRDIEPMRGGYGDNYYYQLVNYVRRYKGARPLLRVKSQPVVVDGGFADWREVTPEFRDTLGDPVRRDHPGWKEQPRFVNQTGRNDLAAAKVSADADKIYFYVRTAGPLTPFTDPNWMLLFLDTDNDPKTGWLGYDFVVNRFNVTTNTATVERNVDGKYQWRSPVEIGYRAASSELELAVPRSALSLGEGKATIDFKWADNIQQAGDWSDFTLNGDAAPNDRFNYRAVLDTSPVREATLLRQ